MVTEPHEEHLMLGADFSLLGSLVPKLSRRLCVTSSEPPRPARTAHTGGLNPRGEQQESRSLAYFPFLRHVSAHLFRSQEVGV